MKYLIYILMVIILISYVNAQGLGNCDLGNYKFGNCELIIGQTTSGSSGGGYQFSDDEINRLIEQQKQYFINSSCSIQVIPQSVFLNLDNKEEIIQIKYLNPYIINFSSSLINLGNLPSALDYIEKNQSTNILLEKINVTISLIEDKSFQSIRFAALVLDFGLCGKHLVPITIEEHIILGENTTVESVINWFKELFEAILNYVNSLIS